MIPRPFIAFLVAFHVLVVMGLAIGAVRHINHAPRLDSWVTFAWSNGEHTVPEGWFNPRYDNRSDESYRYWIVGGHVYEERDLMGRGM